MQTRKARNTYLLIRFYGTRIDKELRRNRRISRCAFASVLIETALPPSSDLIPRLNRDEPFKLVLPFHRRMMLQLLTGFRVQMSAKVMRFEFADRLEKL